MAGDVADVRDWASHGPVPDVLDGFEAVTLPLADDDEGAVVATVVRRLAGAAPATSAVLYVHGYNDYFFHAHLADYWTGRGRDFYALDLRKSGRSLRPWQTPYFMRDVAQYQEELDAALALIVADGHDDVVVNAHSTGGLTTPIWLASRASGSGAQPPGSPASAVRAVVLNSPFLATDPGSRRRAVGAVASEGIAGRRPYAILPSGISDLYVRSIHRDRDGEWDFDLAWKPATSTPLRAGWLAAVRKAQRTLQRGLDLRIPVLVMCSTASIRASEWTPQLQRADAVLNADRIARHATALGRHVTCVRIEGGMHDLVLSRPDVRAEVFAQMTRWLGAYVDR